MKIIFSMAFLFPFLLKAQEIRGIKFENNLTWEQVKHKAQSENKFIFLDCYTTWCIPCKNMDKDVYENDTIGRLINEKFICVKLQMDTTKLDHDEIKARYPIANAIKQQYKVYSFPTYLFFSSKGEAVHTDNGYKTIKQFIEVASNATDPNKQYYTLIENYLKGGKNYNLIPYLLNIAKTMEDPKFVETLSQDYINNYLFKLNEVDLFKKDNIDFIGRNVKSSKDKSFIFFLRNTKKIDKVVKWAKSYSELVLDNIIYKEQVKPILVSVKEGDEPQWKHIYQTIQRKYGKDVAERNVISAKVNWYNKKDWNKYLYYAIMKFEKYGIDSINVMNSMTINNISWDIFLHSNDK